jgi:glycosyltransferase involved in cell wall biosynthesis
MNHNISNPEVTVAIVFFNAMPFFRDSVRSVLAQDFSDFELILLDDGSSDGSLEYAHSISDPRVRVFSDGRNLKLNIRLNESVRLARGKFYFRMDADDVMFPERLSRQLEVLRGSNDRLVLGSYAVCVDKNNRVLGLRRGLAPSRSVYSARHSFIHPTVCARREWFIANPYSEEFVFHRSQDAELWTRTYASSVFMQIPEPLLFYRESLSVNVENYIGSALGTCIIALRQTSLGVVARALWMGGSLLRCWLICFAAILGKSELFVRRRNARISDSLAARYEEVYKAITR